MPRLATQIEAILYLKGKPLAIAEIAEFAGCDRSEVEEAIIELMSDYAHRKDLRKTEINPVIYKRDNL
jgi:segregation and condensation protein B